MAPKWWHHILLMRFSNLQRPDASTDSAELLPQLVRVLGPAHVLTDAAQRTFFSTDILCQGPVVAAVMQPGTVAELQAVLQLCAQAGVAVIPRGGGFSYTQGYVPSVPNSVMVDLRRLNKIVEINAEDMYVTVEAGCTWKSLYDALSERGLRTPYFGPMSGYSATVGGALSQGSFFLGSTQHGSAADSVLGLEVALADGTLIKTGSAASTKSPSPFYRWYGPDLSGLFLGDTGAFGFKVRAHLRLIPKPASQRVASFALRNIEASIKLISDIARRGLAAECYCWDPVFVQRMGAQSDVAQNLRYLKGIVGAASSTLRGLRDAARTVWGSRNVLDGETYLVHVTVDDISDIAADERLRCIREITEQHGAQEVEPVMPRMMRGTPFNEFNRKEMLASGLRNLPVNGMAPHSRACGLAADLVALFDQQRAEMNAQGVTVGIIGFAVGATVICVEPVLMWSDNFNQLHDRVAERSREDLASQAPSLAQQLVTRLRSEIVGIMARHGCAHVQIGKSYPWLATREPDSAQLLKALKNLLDPDGRVNPGSLGFRQ
jgi:FAD/FMN-containing dehydrogenase